MTLAFYIDHHVPRTLTTGLRLRNVDVLTAYEDGGSELDDAALFERATALMRVLNTQDDDFLAEAFRRPREGIPFAGVIYVHQLRMSIGKCVHDLEIIAKAGEPEDLMNGIIFLPV